MTATIRAAAALDGAELIMKRSNRQTCADRRRTSRRWEAPQRGAWSMGPPGILRYSRVDRLEGEGESPDDTAADHFAELARLRGALRGQDLIMPVITDIERGQAECESRVAASGRVARGDIDEGVGIDTGRGSGTNAGGPLRAIHPVHRASDNPTPVTISDAGVCLVPRGLRRNTVRRGVRRQTLVGVVGQR